MNARFLLPFLLLACGTHEEVHRGLRDYDQPLDSGTCEDRGAELVADGALLDAALLGSEVHVEGPACLYPVVGAVEQEGSDAGTPDASSAASECLGSWYRSPAELARWGLSLGFGCLPDAGSMHVVQAEGETCPGRLEEPRWGDRVGPLAFEVPLSYATCTFLATWEVSERYGCNTTGTMVSPP